MFSIVWLSGTEIEDSDLKTFHQTMLCQLSGRKLTDLSDRKSVFFGACGVFVKMKVVERVLVEVCV